MTQVASPESMMGPFTGEKLDVEGVKATFTKKGDQFFPHSQLPQEGIEKKSIVMTTGSHHMQVCWTPTGWERELEIIPFAYLKEDQRWVPRRATFLQPPGTDPSHTEKGEVESGLYSLPRNAWRSWDRLYANAYTCCRIWNCL